LTFELKIIFIIDNRMSNYCQCTTKIGARCKNTVKTGQFCHVHKKCTNPYPGASAPSDRSQAPSSISQASSDLSQASSDLSQDSSDLSQAPSDLSQADTKFVAEVLEFLEMPDVNKTRFQGTALNLYAGILHFLKKYPNACLAGVQLWWNELSQMIKADTNNILNFENCLKNHNVRFIIGLITRYNKNNYVHSNSYLYDKEDNSLEVFEPHGTNVNPTTPKYQKDIRDHFSKLGIENIYFSDDFCPINSFQNIQSGETDKKIGDPSGFCGAWSLWWLNYRLANANSKKIESNWLIQL
jgi:hypothetical protein